jgi:hypothetical protein
VPFDDATNLYTVNPLTGTATLVGPNGLTAGNGIDGLAFLSSASAVPEPATLTLFGVGTAAIGIVSLVGYAWKRKVAAA